MLAPWVATVTPVTLKSPSQFRPVAPPALTSQRYATAYNEVKAMGARFSSARTTDQTNLALFFNTNFLANYNQVARDVANARLSTIDDSARPFALVNLAIAVRVIPAWDTNLHSVSCR